MIEDIGLRVAHLIIGAASVLTSEWAPGIVVIALLVLLLFASTIVSRKTSREARALHWLKDKIDQTSGEEDFAEKQIQIRQAIEAEARSRQQKIVATAWKEYSETLIVDRPADAPIVRNAVRPNTYFNAEDLAFHSGFWRIVPGLFVSVGLFLTFLGLISALDTMGTDMARSGEVTQGAMTRLLTVASAKFIMSLTGLACSIVFTVVLRLMTRRVERAIHAVNNALEHKLSFVSLEGLVARQLKAIQEQRDHIKSIALELVADLTSRLIDGLPTAMSAPVGAAISDAVRPLHAIPEQVSTSLRESLEPIMDRVGHAGSVGMGEIVRGLSERLSGDVGTALGQASERLGEAGDRIGTLVDRMDQSSGRMGGEMETAISRLSRAVDELRGTMTDGADAATGALTKGTEQLLAAMNTTLQGIRDNTAEGAQAMRSAAAEMRTAAEGIRQELEAASKEGASAVKGRMTAAGTEASEAINAAGATVLQAFGKTGEEIARLTEEMAGKAGQELLHPLEAISSKLEEMVLSLTVGADEVRRVSDGLRAGADATNAAAGSFRGSADALVSAAEPIRGSVQSLEGSTRQLLDSTRQIAESARASSQSARTVLEAAEAALASERAGIRATIEGIAQALDRLRNLGDRLDDMDEKLGGAFQKYTQEVETAVNGLFSHVRQMQEKLNPALDTLREVVEQAEEFAPQSRRV